MNVNFSEPTYLQNSIENIKNLFESDKPISYIDKCRNLIREKYDFKDTILTTSCTHALEMMAMILDIGYGDEVIMPSYTFVSTANAFVKFGATIKFIDSMNENPNMDIGNIKELITSKTKAIVVVHYGGWSCNMDELVDICNKHSIYLLEDAAQAINSYYNGKPLGSFGILSAFSFHTTKNINCGEGGMLVINDSKLIDKAHIICDKGTNRHKFIKGKVDKYEWVDKGSSYPMSEINAEFLYPQLENINDITNKRKRLWNIYKSKLGFIEDLNIGILSKEIDNCIGNYHIFYIVFNREEKLKYLQNYLKHCGITASTHYKSLHTSEYYLKNNSRIKLENSEKFEKRLLRMPLHNNLTYELVEEICEKIKDALYYEIKYEPITESNIEKIIKLKQQFWDNDNKSQRDWISKNIKNSDVNVFMYNNKGKLIGYTLVMKRNYNIVDSVIIDEEYRGQGYGGIMIRETTKNVVKSNGFLLCEKKNQGFYERYGWKEIVDVEVINKSVDKDLVRMMYKLSVYYT